MRDATVTRNYAEALLELARRADDLHGWGKLIQDVASAMEDDPKLHLFLESPKVSEAQKSAVLSEALSDRVPRHFLRFLLALVRKRRQMLIPEIATEYHNLVDNRRDAFTPTSRLLVRRVRANAMRSRSSYPACSGSRRCFTST